MRGGGPKSASTHVAAAQRHFAPIQALRKRFTRLGNVPLIRRFVLLHDRLCGAFCLPPVDLSAIQTHDAMAFVLTLRGYDIEHLISNAGRARFGCRTLNLDTAGSIFARIVAQAIDEQHNAQVARKVTARGGAA